MYSGHSHVMAAKEFDYDIKFSQLLQLIKNAIHTTLNSAYETLDFYNEIEGDTQKMSRYIRLAKEIGVPNHNLSKMTDELEFFDKT